MSQDTSLFPLLVKMQDRRCVVVGAGKIAAGKIAGLLAHEAQVDVVSPRAVGSIQKLAREGRIRWLRRKFSPGDAKGAFLVVSATNSRVVNQAVFDACRDHGVLCNAVDDPERCDFFYPAVVRRGPLQIAISTGGRSPALAARLRRELEKQFGKEWGAWVERVGDKRREVMNLRLPARSRRARLLKMASATEFRKFLKNAQPD